MKVKKKCVISMVVKFLLKRKRNMLKNMFAKEAYNFSRLKF